MTLLSFLQHHPSLLCRLESKGLQGLLMARYVDAFEPVAPFELLEEKTLRILVNNLTLVAQDFSRVYYQTLAPYQVFLSSLGGDVFSFTPQEVSDSIKQTYFAFRLFFRGFDTYSQAVQHFFDSLAHPSDHSHYKELISYYKILLLSYFPQTHRKAIKAMKEYVINFPLFASQYPSYFQNQTHLYVTFKEYLKKEEEVLDHPNA